MIHSITSSARASSVRSFQPDSRSAGRREELTERRIWA